MESVGRNPPPASRFAAANAKLGRTGQRRIGDAMPAKRKRWMTAAGAAVALLAAVGAGYAMSRPPEAAVATVQPRSTELALSVVGRARPGDLVQVASPNPGQVVRLLADDGDVVAAGAALAVVRATVERAQVEADEARARAARAEAVEARRDYERTRTLYERGFAARAALDSARAALDSAEANVAAAAATARATAERAREFTVRAPMAGQVLYRPIDPGQVVGAGETLFELGSLAGVEIQAEVEEAYADRLRPGLPARAAAAGSDAVFAARVMEVSPRVDPATGGRLVKLTAADGAALSPGRSVDVTIVVEVRPRAIAVPRRSVVDAAAPKVLVLDDGDRVRARPVTLLRWPSVDAIVVEGLAAGDRVVLEPDDLRDGQRVRPRAARAGG